MQRNKFYQQFIYFSGSGTDCYEISLIFIKKCQATINVQIPETNHPFTI